MPNKPITREYRIYLAIWRKALTSPTMVEIKCPSRTMAIAMRQGMYRAIRPFRNGQQLDEELRLSSEKYVVYLNNETNSLEMRERMTLAALDTMFDQIGIDEADLLLGDERMNMKALEDFIERENVPARVTPFYKRDDS